MSDLTLDETVEVILVDGAGINESTIAPTGDLKVASRPVSPVSDATKLYASSFDVNLPTGGTQTNMVLIRNPSGSTKTFKLIEIGTDITNTVSSVAYYRLYVAPTITGTGTGQAETSLAVGGGASASVMEIYSGPTTSAVGTRIDTWVANSGTGASSYSSEFDGMVTLAAGQDLLLTGTPDGTNRNTMVSIWWLEE